MIGEGGSYFEKDAYSSFYITAFLIGLPLGVLSYSIRGEEVGSWENLHL